MGKQQPHEGNYPDFSPVFRIFELSAGTRMDPHLDKAYARPTRALFT